MNVLYHNCSNDICFIVMVMFWFMALNQVFLNMVIHETEHDVWGSLGNLSDFAKHLEESVYTGLPLDTNSCSPTIKIYLSTRMKKCFFDMESCYLRKHYCALSWS